LSRRLTRGSLVAEGVEIEGATEETIDLEVH